ncbi:MAG: HRDC domain-containing protein, partial [Acidobacteriota bacterium]|nr:HRDC domain-containing protein [Acidobacteriota bacterium]
LLEALRQWRMRASDGRPAYTVAHNSTLEAIATLRPGSPQQLAAIKGVGPAFVERHGADVLALVAESEPGGADRDPDAQASRVRRRGVDVPGL